MNVYVKDSQISADLSTLSATGKDQKGKKFFVDLLMWCQCMCLCTQFYGKLGTGTFPMDCVHASLSRTCLFRQATVGTEDLSLRLFLPLQCRIQECGIDTVHGMMLS